MTRGSTMVRQHNMEMSPMKPGRMHARPRFRAKGVRALSSVEMRQNSERCLEFFRAARQQNETADRPRPASVPPDMFTENKTVEKMEDDPNKRVVPGLRRTVVAAMAARHLMNAGVQVGNGAGLAERLRAKKENQQLPPRLPA